MANCGRVSNKPPLFFVFPPLPFSHPPFSVRSAHRLWLTSSGCWQGPFDALIRTTPCSFCIAVVRGDRACDASFNGACKKTQGMAAAPGLHQRNPACPSVRACPNARRCCYALCVRFDPEAPPEAHSCAPVRVVVCLTMSADGGGANSVGGGISGLADVQEFGSGSATSGMSEWGA